MLLTFISHFVIDFLSICIIFSAIVTDDHHPHGHVLYLQIARRYIVQLGRGDASVHVLVILRPLTSRSIAMRSK